MDVTQRDDILKLVRNQYELVGCVFPKGTYEIVEYLYESLHPDEQRCLLIALAAHNLYTNDTLEYDDFFEWHGL